METFKLVLLLLAFTVNIITLLVDGIPKFVSHIVLVITLLLLMVFDAVASRPFWAGFWGILTGAQLVILTLMHVIQKHEE